MKWIYLSAVAFLTAFTGKLLLAVITNSSIWKDVFMYQGAANFTNRKYYFFNQQQ